MAQFHFDPATYLDMIRAELPAYDRFQDALVEVTRGFDVQRFLDLGTGTGETARRMLRVHPDASFVGIDESEAMLAAARSQLPDADLRVARLQDPLPDGPFDFVVSALAVHHLAGNGKADLFRRVHDVLAQAGRFVLGDVIVPDDPADAITPIEDGYDLPSRIDEQLDWLTAAGFEAALAWQEHDLAILTAAR